jgi:hypothetical protein
MEILVDEKEYAANKRFAARLGDGITIGSCTTISLYRAWPNSIWLLVVNFSISNFNRLQLPGGHSNNSSPAASLERYALENPQTK